MFEIKRIKFNANNGKCMKMYVLKEGNNDWKTLGFNVSTDLNNGRYWLANHTVNVKSLKHFLGDTEATINSAFDYVLWVEQS